MTGPDSLDILIMHGHDEAIVEYLKEFFSSLGLKANNVEKLPSLGLPQGEKVEHYIGLGRLILIVATFSDGLRARPNVYAELQESVTRRRADTLLLRENRDGHAVEIASNLHGRAIEFPFTREEIHRVLPSLLRELRRRDFVRPNSSADETYESGSILNRFLDEMDTIWDEHFDIAWGEIYRESYDHEKDFATLLDRFFQDYQAVFSALIREKKQGSELKAVADDMLAHSWQLAARAWETVADAKRNQLSGLLRSRARNRPDHPSKNATRLVSEAKQEKDPLKQILLFREAITALNKIIDPKKGR